MACAGVAWACAGVMQFERELGHCEELREEREENGRQEREKNGREERKKNGREERKKKRQKHELGERERERERKVHGLCACVHVWHRHA